MHFIFVERTLETAYADVEQEDVFQEATEEKTENVFTVEEARRAAGIEDKKFDDIENQDQYFEEETENSDEGVISEQDDPTDVQQ